MVVLSFSCTVGIPILLKARKRATFFKCHIQIHNSWKSHTFRSKQNKWLFSRRDTNYFPIFRVLRHSINDSIRTASVQTGRAVNQACSSSWHECFSTKFANIRALVYYLVRFAQMKWIHVMSVAGSMSQLRTNDIKVITKIAYFSNQQLYFPTRSYTFYQYWFLALAKSHTFRPRKVHFPAQNHIFKFLSILIKILLTFWCEQSSFPTQS